MSDLSSLLGDLYGEGEKPPAPATPEWASDEALDSAFSDWVPGELGDDPRGKGSILDSPAPATWDLDEDAAGEEWLVATAPPPPATAAPAPAPRPAAAPAPDDVPAGIVDGPVTPTAVEVADEPAVVSEPDPAPVAEAAPVAVITRVWQPSDDDILPSKRARKPKPTAQDTAAVEAARPTRSRFRRR